MTHVVPMKNMTGLTVARAFCEHWVFKYGTPAYLLSGNGGQFASKYFQAVGSLLVIYSLFTTAYHPQANGQVERFNRTILAGLRNYVSEHQRECPEAASHLAYAYNTHVNSTTGCMLFELVIARTPEHLALEDGLALSGPLNHVHEKKRFMESIKFLTAKATEAMTKRQDRTKSNFDAPLRRDRQNLAPDDHVFIQREAPRQDVPESQRLRKKLSPNADGPYKVVVVDSHTVTVLRDGLLEKVSRDRVEPAPMWQSEA